MENVRKYRVKIWRDTVLYGVVAGLFYILYFLIMRAIGLMYNFELRYINLLFTITFAVAALARINGKTRNRLEFLTGLAACMVVGLVSYGLFGAFMFIYLRWFDMKFMSYLVENAPFGEYLTPLNAAAWVIHEGISAMVIIAIITVEAFKLIQISTRSPKPQYK